jgi:hypothetical protein
MNSDENPYTNTTDTAPTPQESVRIDDASKVTPLVTETPVVTSTKENTAGAIVLQWLTYAFWGWTILVVAYLVGITATYMLQGGMTSDATPDPVAYGIAAALILLPVSLLCDFFYSRQEPMHKKGASMVIMVIHAVIFALCAIGTLIAAAFSIVSMVLSSGDHTGQKVVLITAGVVFALYLLTLVRTVKPFMIAKERLIFRIIMGAVVIGICIWGAFGPAAAAALTKDDRALSSSIANVNSEITLYADRNGKLPSDISVVLDGLSSSERKTVKDLTERNLLTYTPNTKSATDKEKTFPGSEPAKVYYYQLCAEYKRDSPKDIYSDNGYSYSIDEDGYNTYLSSSSHTAGKNCYKLKTTAADLF